MLKASYTSSSRPHTLVPEFACRSAATCAAPAGLLLSTAASEFAPAPYPRELGVSTPLLHALVGLVLPAAAPEFAPAPCPHTSSRTRRDTYVVCSRTHPEHIRCADTCSRTHTKPSFFGLAYASVPGPRCARELDGREFAHDLCSGRRVSVSICTFVQ